jgi:predicted Zn-dependent protease
MLTKSSDWRADWRWRHDALLHSHPPRPRRRRGARPRTGALHARVRRLVKRELEPESGRDAALRGVERLAYGMSALIAAIAVLMEAKPF